MFTLTRCKLVSAAGLTAIFVLASVGTAVTVTSAPAVSHRPDSGQTALVAASPTTHTNNGHQGVPVRRRRA
jgi:hypothetical protein